MPKKILFGVWLAVLARGERPREPCVTLAAPRCRGRGGSMPQRPRVTVLGSLNTDISLPVPHLPAPGETVLAAAAASFGAGGKGANQAVAAARPAAAAMTSSAPGCGPGWPARRST